MRRFFLIPLVIVIVVGLVLGGCTKPAPAPTPSPSPAPTQEPIVLTYHHVDSLLSSTHQLGHKEWAEDVERVTRGRVKIKFYPSSTITTFDQYYDATIADIVDIAWGFSTALPGRFPLLDIATLPMLGFENGKMGSECVWKLYEESPEIQKELSDVKVLLLHTSDVRPLCTVSKPISTLEDMKGLKIRSAAGGEARIVEALGGTAVLSAPGDIFQNLEKGVIDGDTMEYSGQISFGLIDVTKYFTDAKLDVVVFILGMNKEKWNSLPPDIQEAIMSVSGAEGAKHFGTNFDRNGYEALAKIVRTPGKEFIILSPEERARWAELAGPIQEDYVAKLESEGLPGREILAKIKSLIKEYKGAK